MGKKFEKEDELFFAPVGKGTYLVRLKDICRYKRKTYKMELEVLEDLTNGGRYLFKPTYEGLTHKSTSSIDNVSDCFSVWCPYRKCTQYIGFEGVVEINDEGEIRLINRWSQDRLPNGLDY